MEATSPCSGNAFRLTGLHLAPPPFSDGESSFQSAIRARPIGIFSMWDRDAAPLPFCKRILQTIVSTLGADSPPFPGARTACGLLSVR